VPLLLRSVGPAEFKEFAGCTVIPAELMAILAEVVEPDGSPLGSVAQTSSPPEPAQPSLSRRRRWFRRLLCLTVLVGAAYLFRAPLLRGLADGLVVGEPAANPAGVLILNLHALDVAGELSRSHPSCQLLVMDFPPSPVVSMGILPTRVEMFRDAIRRHGLPLDRLTALPSNSWTTWDTARGLGVWLNDHPDESVVVLCNRFDSRCLRYILDTILPAEAAGRVRVQAVADDQYDESNWWQSKKGKLAFFGSYLSLAHAWVHGDDAAERIPWNLDLYELKTRPAP
jgi:hypothetical protein